MRANFVKFWYSKGRVRPTLVYRENTLLSKAERSVLETFRRFLMLPGQMLCFNGQDHAKRRDALRKLTEKGYLVKEGFHGAYSLTRTGYAAMRDRRNRVPED